MVFKEYQIKITIDEQIDSLFSKLNKLKSQSSSIKFTADISKLEEQLAKLSKQTKVDTTNFTKLQREVDKVDKSISKLDKTIDVDVNDSSIDKLKDNLSSIPKTIDINIGGTIRSFNNVKQAIRELTQDLLKLKESGQTSSPLYGEIASQLGELKRLRSQVEGSVKSSQTFGISKYTSALEGLTAVSSVSSGIGGLFGQNSQEFEKTLSKFANIQMILSGLQTLNAQLANSSSLLSKIQSKIASLASIIVTPFNIIKKGSNNWTRTYKVFSNSLSEYESQLKSLLSTRKKWDRESYRGGDTIIGKNARKELKGVESKLDTLTTNIANARAGLNRLFEERGITTYSKGLQRIDNLFLKIGNTISRVTSPIRGFFNKEALSVARTDYLGGNYTNISDYFRTDNFKIGNISTQFKELNSTTAKWMNSLVTSNSLLGTIGRTGVSVLSGLAKLTNALGVAFKSVGVAMASLGKRILVFYALMKVFEVAFDWLDKIVDTVREWVGWQDKLLDGSSKLSYQLEYFNSLCESTISNLETLQSLGTINPLQLEDDKLKAYASLLNNINNFIPKNPKIEYGFFSGSLKDATQSEINNLYKQIENSLSGKPVTYTPLVTRYIGDEKVIKDAIHNLLNTANSELTKLRPLVSKYLSGDDSYKIYYDQYKNTIKRVTSNVLYSFIPAFEEKDEVLKQTKLWYDKATEALSLYNKEITNSSNLVFKDSLERRSLLAEINDDEIEKAAIERDKNIAENPQFTELYNKIYEKRVSEIKKSKAKELKALREQQEQERKTRIESQRKLENDIAKARIELMDEGWSKVKANLLQQEKEAIESTDNPTLKELYKKKFAKQIKEAKETYEKEFNKALDSINIDWFSIDELSNTIEIDKLKRVLGTTLGSIFDKSDIEKYYNSVRNANERYIQSLKELNRNSEDIRYSKALAEEEKSYNTQLEQLEEYAKKYSDKRELIEQKKQELVEYHNAKLESLNKEHLNNIESQDRESFKNLQDIIKDYYNGLLEDLSVPQYSGGSLSKYLKDLKEWQSKAKSILNNAQNNLTLDYKSGKLDESTFNELSSSISKKIKSLTKEVEEAIQQSLSTTLSYINQVLNAFSDILSNITNAINQYYDSQLTQLEDEYDKLEEELSKQEELVENHNNTLNDLEEELANARGDRRDRLIEQINSEKEARLEALALEESIQKKQEANKKKQEVIEAKQRKVEKASNIAQATMSTYTAAANALSVKPFWLGLVLASLAVATGLTYVGMIASTKYAKGGLLQGPSHLNGGIKTPYGELEGNEYVINKRTTSKNLPLLSYINSKDKELTSNDLIEFFRSNKPSDTTIKPLYASGGYLPNKQLVFIEDTRPIEVSVVDIINKSNNVRKVQVLSGQ